MKEEEQVLKSNREDISGAVDFFIRELTKAPMAPALAGPLLDRYNISDMRLSEFVRTHLRGKVVLISNKLLSPVGRPALALESSLTDPSYWARFRLSSLYRVWEDARVEMAALNRSEYEAANNEVATGLEASEFAKRFPKGLCLDGKIIRRANSGTGLIVEVSNGASLYSCFMPLETLPLEERNRTDALLGTSGKFEVVSVLPEKRSVWLRMLRQTPKALEMGAEERKPTNNDFADIEAKLTFVRTLHDKGLLTDAEYEDKRKELLSRI